MPKKTTNDIPPNEATIFLRVLCNQEGKLPPDIARYFLGLEFSADDKTRMHDLAVRNQEGTLSPVEKEELFAYVKAGDWLTLLHAGARRSLGVKAKQRTVS